MEVTPHHHPQHPPLAAMDCYEDMFKEITRKLYGEEGLPENAQGPEGGGGADGGMRMMDYGEGGGGGGGAGGGDAGSGALSAFGLALMHNGFQSPADMKFRAPVHPAHLNHHHLNHHLNHHHLANHHHHINHLANHHAHPLIHHAPVHHAPPPPTAHYASPPPPPPPQQQQPPPPPPQQPSPAAAVPTSTSSSSSSSNAGATANAAASTPTTLGSTTPTAASSSSNLPPSSDDKWLTSDDALPWTTSKIASYNPAQKLFKCSECDCVGFLSRVAEHWLGTHANLRVFQCPQCPYASAWARCVRMHLTRQHSGGEGGGGGATTPNGTPQPPDSPQPYGADGNSSSSSASPSPWKENPVLEEVTKFLQALRSRVEEKGDGGGGGSGGGGFASSTGSSAPRNGGGGGSGEPGTATATPTTGGSGSGSGKGGGRRGGGNNASGGSGSNSGGEKRYCCPACPYATDRRDLFTRHENIHRDEKPFQCYVCAKQFNRADHVKKHFLRMHRDHPYDLNKIRRSPPKNASGMSFYHKYNGGSGSGSEGGGPESSGSTTPGTTNGNANNSRNVLQQPSHLQAPSLIPAPLAASLMHSNHHAHLGSAPQNHQHLGLHSAGNYQISGTGKMGGGGKRNHHNGMKGGVLSGNGADAGTGKPKKPKKVGDKRYSCCYCAWSGADNWCLKRHLNTHIKPFLCPLCDYKAARSERLATHVLKVHNKRACAKCAFLGDDQLALSEHVQEHHPTEIKNTNRTSNNTLLRNVAFPCYQPAMSSSFCEASRGHRTLSDSTLLYRYNGCGRNNINRGGNGWRRGYSSQLGGRSWGPARNHPFSTSPRGKWCGGPLVRGAGKKVALGRGGSTSSGANKGSVVLKVGASGGGGGATVTLRGAEGRRLSQCAVCSFRSADERSMADHLRIRHGLPHRWGDTVRELRPFYTDQNTSPTRDSGTKQTRMVVNLDDEEEEEEDVEASKRKRRWPPYECRQCGCEFANKWSLENHIAMHHKSGNTQDFARFVKAPGERHPYICSVCGLATASQAAMMRHLRFHSGLSLRCKAGGGCIYETTSETALVEHVRSSHDDKDFTARCPHCGHGSSTPAAYARHSAIHHPAALSSNGRHVSNFQSKIDDPDVEEITSETQKDEQPCKMCAEVFLKHFFLSLEKLHQNGIGNGHVPGKNNNNNNNNEMNSHSQKLPNGLLDAVIGGLSEVATPVRTAESSNQKSSEWTASMEEASRLRRSRKQSRPRKLVMAALDPSEIQVLNEPMKRRRKRRWRKRRRKRMAERMRWLHSLQEAEMHMPRIRVARRFPESLRGLRDKYVQRRKLGRASRWWRGPFHCAWCQEAGVTFRTRAGLALHDFWRHLRGASCIPPLRVGRFECGQCGDRFPHQYQVVLHAGRVHVGNVTLDSAFNKSGQSSSNPADVIEGTSASLSILESLNSSSLAPQLGHTSPPPPPAPHLPKCDFPPHIQSSSPIPLSLEVNANYTTPSVPVANVVSALASS
ncbi:zinc finger protein 865 [Hetaerina americana]|uniref:zinc finger protein 865 n=1 Tax=Hetaerina americana TaxID=62018 RepID=UPI003A7F2527